MKIEIQDEFGKRIECVSKVEVGHLASMTKKETKRVLNLLPVSEIERLRKEAIEAVKSNPSYGNLMP